MRTIFIVEDDEIAQVGLVTVLQSYGYTARALAGSQDAIDAVHAGETPDLILLDMVNPRSDGWHFFVQRRRDPILSQVPVVVMTGLGIASEEWARALGGVALLRKPLDIEKLLDTIRRYTENGVAV